MADWSTILAREGPLVWRTVYRLLGNRADAEECFQETFLSALEFSRREKVDNWSGLLKRLAGARAIDRLRQRRRRRTHEEPPPWEDAPCDAPAVDLPMESAELAESLRDAIAQLPRRQAEAFSLHCIEGWTYHQIADLFSSTTDAVGVLIFRARARLKDLLRTRLPELETMVEKRVAR